jgi:hypothetical protein
MHRALAILAILLAGSGAASAADRYACASLAGDPGVTADFTLSYSSRAYAVLGAGFRIEDEIGYSTEASDPRDRALVSAVDVSTGAEDISFSLLAAEGGYASSPVARLHVVTLPEGAHMLTAGVLQVTGGGLWPIRCDVDGG